MPKLADAITNVIGKRTMPPRIVVAIDVSGAMPNLGDICDEIGKAVAGAREVHVLQCGDHIVHNCTLMGAFRTVKPEKLEGCGGGTRYEPVFEHVEEMRYPPALLIYITDGYGTFPTKEPGYPVIWVGVADGNKPPFGEVIGQNWQ
jgi:predicted metal-dependent peptidase